MKTKTVKTIIITAAAVAVAAALVFTVTAVSNPAGNSGDAQGNAGATVAQNETTAAAAQGGTESGKTVTSKTTEKETTKADSKSGKDSSAKDSSTKETTAGASEKKTAADSSEKETSAGNGNETQTEAATEKQEQETVAGHTHSWTAVTKQEPVYKTVHHAAVTHEEPVYEEVYHEEVSHQEERVDMEPVWVSDTYVRCVACGEEFLVTDGETGERYDGNNECYSHQLAVHGHYTNTSVVTHGRIIGYEEWHTGLYTTVVDQEAYTETVLKGYKTVTDQEAYDEKVLDHYETVTLYWKCNGCGATKEN